VDDVPACVAVVVVAALVTGLLVTLVVCARQTLVVNIRPIAITDKIGIMCFLFIII